MGGFGILGDKKVGGNYPNYALRSKNIRLINMLNLLKVNNIGCRAASVKVVLVLLLV